MSEMLHPISVRLSEVHQSNINVKVDLERQRNFVIDNIDYVRGLGNAN